MLKYEQLSPEVTEKIENDRANNTLPQLAFDENKVLRSELNIHMNNELDLMLKLKGFKDYIKALENKILS